MKIIPIVRMIIKMEYFFFRNNTTKEENDKPISYSLGRKWARLDLYEEHVIRLIFEEVIKKNKWSHGDEIEALGDNGSCILYRHSQIYFD